MSLKTSLACSLLLFIGALSVANAANAQQTVNLGLNPSQAQALNPNQAAAKAAALAACTEGRSGCQHVQGQAGATMMYDLSQAGDGDRTRNSGGIK